MNKTEHLLSCLAEECAEVIKCCTKAQRFGLSSVYGDKSNAERLRQEIIDLYGAIQTVFEHEVLEPFNMLDIADEVQAKVKKIERHMGGIGGKS